MNIRIITIASPLHDEQVLNEELQNILSEVKLSYQLSRAAQYVPGNDELPIYHIATGGTENIFLQTIAQHTPSQSHPIYLLTTQRNNSLAASLEILSYLNAHGMRGEILHGTPKAVAQQLHDIQRMADAEQLCRHANLGIIGKPSDWLISSTYDTEAIEKKLSAHLLNIDINELIDAFHTVTDMDCFDDMAQTTFFQRWEKKGEALPKAMTDATRIYLALKILIQRYQLTGLTLRCFDLLGTLHNTGCWALARLNAEGIIATCEGDVPAMLSMLISKALTGQTGFMANPSFIDYDNQQIIFAHCTIPLDMVKSYAFDTHFESGIGIGICGQIEGNRVTIFKTDGTLSRCIIDEATLTEHTYSDRLCRTQIKLHPDQPETIKTMLSQPIGNHQIILQGEYKQLIAKMLDSIKNN